MSRVIFPEPVGPEVSFWDKKFTNSFVSSEVELLVSCVDFKLNCICETLNASESIALINYAFLMREVQCGVSVCRAEGGSFLSVGSPPRDALIESVQEYCSRNLRGSLKKLRDYCSEPYLLDCRFCMEGFRDTITCSDDGSAGPIE